jgi:aspartate-semialdehyde dehydrogenase
VLLVGGDTLIGRELRDVLAGETGLALKLAASDDSQAGLLTEQGGEPAIIGAFDPDNLSGARAVFLAGTPESTRKALASGGAGFIDLTYAAEDDPRSRLRAPLLEATPPTLPSDTVHLIAHPAAVGLALVLSRLHAASPVRRAVVNVFEPASERGAAGMDEMQEQSVNLLSFKKLPKKTYDTQVSFNLLARLGEEAPAPLEDVELRIERHLAALLGISGSAPKKRKLERVSAQAPLPSIRLLQAPVFHGHSCSLWVEFEANPGVEAIESVLAPDPVDVRGSGLEPPSIANIAGQSGIAVGAVAVDRVNTQACWLWLVLDNLRVSADNAVAVAKQLLA